MKKELVLASVQNSVSSIFTKEDVIKLINSVEGGRVISVYDIGRAIDNVIGWMEDNPKDIIDEDSAEFSLEYNNKVMIRTVEIDTDIVREALENNFMDFGELVDDDSDLECEVE